MTSTCGSSTEYLPVVLRMEYDYGVDFTPPSRPGITTCMLHLASELSSYIQIKRQEVRCKNTANDGK